MMWIEMSNLNLELYSNTAEKKVTTVPTPPQTETAPAGPAAELKTPPSTEISLQLQKFQQKIQETPIVNEQKVAALKQQIADRTFPILNSNMDIVKDSAMRMADRMLNLENDLFVKKT
jgi:anti-sigma28 factor (negative regulator of flagellin synthesis)